LEENSRRLDAQDLQIKEMFDHNLQKFICLTCGKQYKKEGHLKRHLKEKHEWNFIEEDQQEGNKPDHIALYRSSFMKCMLLLRDTNDSYTMGDGERIMMNSKFQMLLSGVSHHTKYQLWLFRFLAYYHCLLSPKDAYEYKWNCTSNLGGGVKHNIPNDNLVEIMVHRLKEKLQTQGANVTFSSARKAALSLQIQDELKTNMKQELKMKPTGSTRPDVQKPCDIRLMIEELNKGEVFEFVPGRKYTNFPAFKDLFSRIKLTELHKWITDQKQRMSYEIV
jgi:hypothetical protein